MNFFRIDSQGIKNLFDDYFEGIRRYVFYRCGDQEVATDIAQDTFLRIWQKHISMEPGTAKRLLLKIAGDLFVSRYRKEKRAFEFLRSGCPIRKSGLPTMK